MNTSITLTLDSRKNCRRKDGTFPIILRICHGPKSSTSIPTGYSVSADDWDERNHKIRESCKAYSSVKRLNNLLIRKKADALDIVIKLEEEGFLPSMSVADIKHRILNGENGRSSFFEFTKALVKNMKKAEQFGNARVYEDFMKVLKSYQRGKDICFEEITYKYLCDYEAHYLSKGNTLNGLSVNLRTLRAIYNKAIKSKLVDPKFYPFSGYKIKNEKTQKRALPRHTLMEIVNLKLEPTHPLFNARNYFLISYNLYGMNFIDLAFLKTDHIQEDRISYRRKKTSRLYDVHLSPALAELLSYYVESKGPGEFVFPLLKEDDLEKQYAEVKYRRKDYNRDLKGIAKLLNIRVNLTSYVVRHSFATQAVWNEVPLKAIQELLGHESIKTTETYIADLPKKVVDRYASQLALG